MRWRLAWVGGFAPLGFLSIQFERHLSAAEQAERRRTYASSDKIGREATITYPCVPWAVALVHEAWLKDAAIGETWERSGTGNQWGRWREAPAPEWALPR